MLLDAAAAAILTALLILTLRSLQYYLYLTLCSSNNRNFTQCTSSYTYSITYTLRSLQHYLYLTLRSSNIHNVIYIITQCSSSYTYSITYTLRSLQHYLYLTLRSLQCYLYLHYAAYSITYTYITQQ